MGKALNLLVAANLAFGLMSGGARAEPEEMAAATPQIIDSEQKTQARAEAAKKHHVSPRRLLADHDNPLLRSAAALVMDQTTGEVLYEKNANAQLPIASITKLMTAMVVLDAKLDLQEELTIGRDEVRATRGSRSRLRIGTRLTREELLRLALMASENRAAAALSRYYPGGREAFVNAMNQKAQSLDLAETHFEDPTGLKAANVSSARDLTRLVAAAHGYPPIREFSTAARYQVMVAGRSRTFHNTNRLVKSDKWEIGLSKTGYISQAGKCLVMQALLNNRPTIIVLLDSWGKLTRIGDANRIRRWVESAALPQFPSES
ncbi:MAG: D-alanyl-D-alanine endopeptidase [Gammaproteobacteria bacterium]|nr:D-alanyl-D-alanine endopeptidase [Gammaproteobacteria bacterium]MBU1415603.1 D-alanyl-D-alanine endopeptidase [Gammaproteobacteria bacterium]